MTKVEHSYLFLVGACVAALVGIAVFATPTTASAHNGLSGKNHHASSTNLTCMQTAVGVRETAVGAAYDAHATSIKAALAARKVALNTAWGMTDAKARNTAIKSAWKEYRIDRVDSRKDFSKAKRDAWKTFKATAKTSCKETVPADEGESNDSDV